MNVAAMMEGRKRYIERRQAFGLKAPGGRPRKIGRVRCIAAEAAERLAIVVAELGQKIVEHRASEALPSAASVLNEAAYQGASRLLEICSMPIDMEQPKVARLIGDMSAAVLRLDMRVVEGEYRARRDGAMAALLAEIAEEARAHRSKKTEG
jgi:hypothetical protein